MSPQRVPGYCTLCKSHCGSVSVIEENRLLAVEPLHGHPSGGALCAKGRAMPELLADPKRLTTPLRRTNPKDSEDPGWVPISWDEALDEITERLGEIRAESGAESVAFAITTPSGTPMVDGFEWVNRFVRCFGSPNIIYATEICGWHKNFAHAFTYGKGIGIPDYRNAELILLWGHNPARTWLAQASAVAEARRDGAKVVVIDPKRGGSGQQADQWLRIRPGTDGALALGAINQLINEGGYAEEFVRSWTNAPLLVDEETGELLDESLVWDTETEAPRFYDTERELERPSRVALRGRFQLSDGRKVSPVFELLAEHVAEWTLDKVVETTWIPREELTEFYALLANHSAITYYCWTGVGQHTNATQTERAMGVLYALLGAYDQPGGIRWLDKHRPNPLGPFSLLEPEQRAKTLGLEEMPLGPPAQGNITARDFRRAALEGEPYRVRAMVGFGANMVVSQGAAEENRKALRALDFQVQCDMFVNPTAETADIVLPVCAPPEREGLLVGFENTIEGEEHVQLRPRMVDPIGQSRSDYDIVFGLAERFGMRERFFDCDLEAGWNYQLEPLGLTVQQLRERPEGVRLPIEQRTRKYAETKADGTVTGFATPSGRVELYSSLLREHGQPALPSFTEPDEITPGDARFPYVLTTAKNGHYTHSSLRNLASLRKRSPDPGLELHPALAEQRGLVEGDWAVVSTPDGQARLRVRLDETLHERVAVAEHGWWEANPQPVTPGMAPLGEYTSNVNAALSDRRRDPVSGSVPLRAVACDIRKDELTSAGNWSGWRAFRVVARETAEAGALSLTLRPVDGAELPDFRPGQHVQLRAPELGAQRAYSLTAVRDGALRIMVKQIGGRMSGHLHGEAPEILELRAPSGTFTPPVGGDRPVLCIGGGIGVTPFLGYLERLVAGAPAPPRVELVYTRRRETGPAPISERLRELAEQLPSVTVRERLTGPDSTRFSIAELEESLLTNRPLVYLCGPAAMMTELTEGLRARGIPEFDVFTEEFLTEVEIPEHLEPATVRFARSGKQLRWTPESGTLLDAAESAGIQLPSGCRTGACESCRVEVRSGDFAHLASVENEPGACLTCQAIPLSDLVVDS